MTLAATPIGNAADITLQALETLRHADMIACEDTRVSRSLLIMHSIVTPTLSYHEHNAARMRLRVLGRLRQSEAVAMVTDADMPLISDPGLELVRSCLDEGFPVTVVPGASASLAALVLSDLPSDRCLFAGFPTAKAVMRRSFLEGLGDADASLIFRESARRLAAYLEDMAAIPRRWSSSVPTSASASSGRRASFPPPVPNWGNLIYAFM